MWILQRRSSRKQCWIMWHLWRTCVMNDSPFRLCCLFVMFSFVIPRKIGNQSGNPHDKKLTKIQSETSSSFVSVSTELVLCYQSALKTQRSACDNSSNMIVTRVQQFIPLNRLMHLMRRSTGGYSIVESSLVCPWLCELLQSQWAIYFPSCIYIMLLGNTVKSRKRNRPVTSTSIT